MGGKVGSFQFEVFSFQGQKAGMIPLSPEWAELFEWLRNECRQISRPKRPRGELLTWLHEQDETVLVEADEALMDWLLEGQWPLLSEEAATVIYLKMSFAWSLLVTGMERQWTIPKTHSQRIGTLHGLVFREWASQGEDWMRLFVRSSPTDADGHFSN